MSEKTIDLNVDIGEGFEHDFELIEYASSVNIACGWHAGDPLTMRRVTTEAIRKGVAVGAHPSFPDRENFGRVPMRLPTDEIYAGVQYQVGALAAVVAGLNGELSHVKPHGALYNMAEMDEELAFAIVRAIRDYDPRLAIYGLAGGQLVRVAHEAGLPAIDEAFADRGYTADGKLVPRSDPGAFLDTDEASKAQVVDIIDRHCVRSVDGQSVSLRARSICLHGDGAHAVDFARMLRKHLANAGVGVIAPVPQIVGQHAWRIAG